MAATRRGPRADLAAVLLDMDGTLVDTEPAWMAAETALARAHGATWTPEQALSLVGSALPDAAEAWRRGTGLTLPDEVVVADWLDRVVASVRTSVPWRPGARELLADLHHHEVPRALVTMSWRPLADAVLTTLPADTFDAVVTGDEVTHGKPDPEPYRRAAELLGVDVRRCVAVEDSATGAASAEAAGCVVVVVPHHAPVPAGPRRVSLPGLEGVGVAELTRWLADHTDPGTDPGTEPGTEWDAVSDRGPGARRSPR